MRVAGIFCMAKGTAVMTLSVDEAPPSVAPADIEDFDTDARSVEKLLLGFIALAMVLWFSLFAWLLWWLVL